MRRSEIPAVFCKFKDLHQRVLRTLQLEQDDPSLKEEFDLLTLLVTENLDLFSEEERSFILNCQAVFLTPRYRVARQRSHSRSASPSRSESTSSPDSSFASASMDSAAMSDTSKTAPEGAADAASRQLKELELRCDMEEQKAALRDQIHDEKRRIEDARRRVEDEERKVKKQLEEKQMASRRAILKRAQEESLSGEFVADLLKSLEAVTIEKDFDSTSPSNSPSPPTASVPVSSPPTDQEDRLLQLLGSQRLKSSLPKDADQFQGDVLGYPKFIAKFTTDVMEVDGVTDAEKYSALQDRTRGEARKIVDTYVYLKSKSQALKKA